ncbi:polyribonucleotide nucleotidyltransferase [Ichthyobacterium seriolicida]|uniref:Polyribonucleotide nucleotidyltransferase n=1 Tax=Ichthyobacterium seriolicida TaxID=242600 RepID=A0A1J1EBT1_9FLAO|nr:polyribonucleotide nucleotidyltransferase [Ichthyobacterium seriolicida]BAV95395.1 polyribonucleotide nucleotidyltransferase [Ichthyobacterium seriolicida]
MKIPQITKETINLVDGRTISLETGKLARQADGAVVVSMGGTMLLATVVASKTAKEGADFFPLTVDYREKFFASGKIPKGYVKREARPSDDEVLTMRLVDRVLRPLFPKDYYCEVQVMIQLISYEEGVLPDALVGLAASAAISVSDIPFEGPISEVRVARIDGEFVINPTKEQLKSSDMDMIIGASQDSIVMLEGEMGEVSERDMIEGMKVAHEAIKEQIKAQLNLVSKLGLSDKKREYSRVILDKDLYDIVNERSYDKCVEILKSKFEKRVRNEKFESLLQDIILDFDRRDEGFDLDLVKGYFNDVKKKAVRNMTLNEGIRIDGRSHTDIRDIWCEVDYLPFSHGSAIFTRGETQSLTSVTLGNNLDANRKDGVTNKSEEKFFLHYNFPPFSTGEVKPIRGVSRREIGHGNLAERALKGMIPHDCPYTVRVVSDILESNGSSSMATVCAGTMALMDAGVKMKKHVSGIAMGLIIDENNSENFAVLSDILGDEDHLGDMDFKVTGTKDGLTSCQMDMKVKGLSYEILEKALTQAKEGRMHILNKLIEAIPHEREALKPHCPKIVVIEISKEFIGAVIGPGGKVIQEMQLNTGVTISIEEKNEKGIIEIIGVNQEGIDKAVKEIEAITFVPEIGEVYNGIVKSVVSFGAFIEIAKGHQALLHISEIAWSMVEKVEDHLTEGQQLEVKLVGKDPKTGKFRLSRKVLIEKPVQQ